MRKTGQYAYPQVPWDHQKFKKIVKERGYLIAQVIKKVYFCPSYYYRLEKYRDTIPLPMAEALCDFLGVSIDDCKPD